MNSEHFIILITGTNRGLGFFLADYFLKAGHVVISLNKSKNSDILTLKQKYQDRLYIISCDVSNENKIINAYKKVKKTTSYIDILINNAGIHLEPHKPDIRDIDFSPYIPTFSVNALGPLMIVRHFLPFLLKGGKKLIVNISSEAGSIGNSTRESEFAYCMSKAALNMASKILHNRLIKEGIKVLAMHPGWFSSDMGGPDAPKTPEQAAVRVADTILKKRTLTGPVYIDPEGKEMGW